MSIPTRLIILDFLESAVVKTALILIFKTPEAAGFLSWITEIVLEELFDEVARPLLLRAIRKGNLYYNKEQGAIKVRKRHEALEAGNEQAYLDSFIDPM